MKCVILQPSYIPWRGYFHQIQKADVFVFYDDVQYDRDGWRNRNKIKTANGSIWLTIPVLRKGSSFNNISINKIKISQTEEWVKKHLASLRYSYSKAPYFEKYFSLIENQYLDAPEFLADLTINLTMVLARALGIAETAFLRSSELQIEGQKTDRLIAILKAVGSNHYISGPSAKDYIESEKFERAGITLEYMSYEYREYPQLHPPFDPQVSILDLLFMTGSEAHKYIWQQTA